MNALAPIPSPRDYNVRLYLVQACALVALQQASDPASPLREDRSSAGAPAAVAVAGAAGGARFSSAQAAGVDMTPAAAGVAG